MDGFTSNNTYVLEKELGWLGICVECQNIHLVKLRQHRTSTILARGLWRANGFISFSARRSCIVKEFCPDPPIQTVTFPWIFEHYNVPNVIDYISLDIEGAEYEALTKFPFDTHKAILWTIEHNLYVKNDPTLKNQVKDILLANGYMIAQENVGCPDTNGLPFEDWFIHKDYIK